MSATENAPWYSPLFSLRWRLAVVYSALFGIFVIFLSIFLYSSVSSLLLRDAQMAFPQRARALRTSLTGEACSAPAAKSQVLKSFIQQNVPADVDVVYLLDKSGKVIVSSNGNLPGQPFPYIAASFFTRAPTGAIQAFHIHTPQGISSDGLLLPLQATSTCLAPQNLPGYIALLTSYASEQMTLHTILFTLAITSLLIILAGALIISFFTGVMFKPLYQVTRATRALARGDLRQRVPSLQSHDEIADLAKSFNQMADRIEQTFISQQASERRAQRFVSDASHELRTPITSLRGFTEVLIRGAKDDPGTAQHILSLMKNEAERMTDLVNDLLTLARLDEGNFPEPEIIDLVAVAVECLQQARKQAPEGCKLVLDLATQERLKIQASGEQIQQMLVILLDNAIKYGCTSDSKKIWLHLDKKDTHIQAQIVDHGAGILPEDLPHIFDRFYRGENAHSSTNTPIAGTGLGLSIALAIAQAYRGTLAVCSEPGSETVFTASFPYAE